MAVRYMRRVWRRAQATEYRVFKHLAVRGMRVRHCCELRKISQVLTALEGRGTARNTAAAAQKSP